MNPTENDKKEEKVEKNELEQRKNTFKKEFEELRKKHKIDLLPQMDFFEFKILPIDLQLAIQIIGKYHVRYVYDLVETKDKSNDN